MKLSRLFTPLAALGLGVGFAMLPAGTAHAAGTLSVDPSTISGKTTVTVRGSGYQIPPNKTTGGIYVLFGHVQDGWGPSMGGKFGYKYFYPGGKPGEGHQDGGSRSGSTAFVSFPNSSEGDDATASMDASGNWSVRLTVAPSFTTVLEDGTEKKFSCARVQCGIYTIGAHGVSSRSNEAFTPITVTSTSSGTSSGSGTRSGSGTSSGSGASGGSGSSPRTTTPRSSSSSSDAESDGDRAAVRTAAKKERPTAAPRSSSSGSSGGGSSTGGGQSGDDFLASDAGEDEVVDDSHLSDEPVVEDEFAEDDLLAEEELNEGDAASNDTRAAVSEAAAENDNGISVGLMIGVAVGGAVLGTGVAFGAMQIIRRKEAE